MPPLWRGTHVDREGTRAPSAWLILCNCPGFKNTHTCLLSHALESICFTVISSISIKISKNKKEIYHHKGFLPLLGVEDEWSVWVSAFCFPSLEKRLSRTFQAGLVQS